jgi:uncharacterized caspase-like protein
MRKICVLALLAALAQSSGWAENRALLIGVGKYRDFPERSLDGPPYDVAKLESVLKEKWGFQDIVKLVDEGATGAAIRAALAALSSRVKPGDQIFIYFSGHGTSAYDPKMSAFCADAASGCLIPYDVKRGKPQEVIDSILLGKRDFRPVLSEIERKSPGGVFVTFDACYSENSAKAVQTGRSTTRELPMNALVKFGASDDDYDAAFKEMRPANPAAAAAEPYPYSKVVFLSASAKDEKAQDIPKWMLEQQQARTVDNNPHGRMTDAFLRGLEGEADQNHDGRVSYRELHDFTLKMMRGVQNPQLQSPGSTSADQPVFGVLTAPSPPKRDGRGDIVRVRLDPSASQLAGDIAKMKSVEVNSPGPVDFTVTRLGKAFVLALESGLEVRRYSDAETGALLARIKAEPRVRKLMEWSYPNQKSNVSLRFSPEGRGVYYIGEELMFKMSADRASFFLLVNIDTGGMVTVIYPPPKESARLTKAAETGGAVAGPETGAEYMKLFAFSQPGSDTSNWAGTAFEAGSPEMDKLLKFVDRTDGAEASLVLFSAPRK